VRDVYSALFFDFLAILDERLTGEDGEEFVVLLLFLPSEAGVTRELVTI